MIDLLLAPQTKPFAVALGLVVLIALVELVVALFGASASAAIDSLLPDLDADLDLDYEVDASLAGGGALDLDTPSVPDAPSPGPLSAVLGWLCVGRVPILILLILFLSAFGVSGILAQWASRGVFGTPMPAWLVAVPALAAAFPFTRATGLSIARIMPREQTEAVSQREFIGKVARIIRGEARDAQPAEAKVTDSHGRTHYLLVEPDNAGEVFGTEDNLIIVGRTSNIYRVVRNANPAMRSE